MITAKVIMLCQKVSMESMISDSLFPTASLDLIPLVLVLAIRCMHEANRSKQQMILIPAPALFSWQISRAASSLL